jgi:hypothetical protein
VFRHGFGDSLGDGFALLHYLLILVLTMNDEARAKTATTVGSLQYLDGFYL